MKPRRKVFAVLPTMLTLGNLVCGFGCITFAAKLVQSDTTLPFSALLGTTAAQEGPQLPSLTPSGPHAGPLFPAQRWRPASAAPWVAGASPSRRAARQNHAPSYQLPLLHTRSLPEVGPVGSSLGDFS